MIILEYISVTSSDEVYRMEEIFKASTIEIARKWLEKYIPEIISDAYESTNYTHLYNSDTIYFQLNKLKEIESIDELISEENDEYIEFFIPPIDTTITIWKSKQEITIANVERDITDPNDYRTVEINVKYIMDSYDNLTNYGNKMKFLVAAITSFVKFKVPILLVNAEDAKIHVERKGDLFQYRNAVIEISNGMWDFKEHETYTVISLKEACENG